MVREYRYGQTPLLSPGDRVQTAGTASSVSRKFFQNASWLAAAEFLSRLKGFVLIPLTTAYLGTLNYGVWAQVAVIVGLVPPLIMLGTDSAIARFLPGETLARQRAHFTAWALFFGAAGAIAAVIVGLLRVPIAELFFGSSGEYARFVPLAAGSVFATAAVNIMRSWFRVQGRAKPISVLTIGQSFLGLLIVVYVLVAQADVFALVLLTLVGDASLALVFALAIARERGWAKPDFSIIGKLVRFGLPLVPAGYAVWALNWLDRIFLVAYTTLEQIGIYSLAYTLGYLVIQVAISPIFFMFPNTAAEHWNRGDRPPIQKLFEQSAGLIVLIVVPTIVGSAVLGTALLSVMATDAFAAGGPVIPIILAGYTFTMLSAYYETMLGLVHRQYLSTVAAVLAFFVNLGLNFLLIPRYGITGAAIATSSAFLVQLSFTFTLATRAKLLHTPFQLPLKAVAVSLAMGAAVLGLNTPCGRDRAVRVPRSRRRGVVIYTALAFVTGVIPRDLVQRELRRLRARGRTADAPA